MSEEQGLTPYETREILFYKTENGEVRVEILLFQENLWLTQAKMAELSEKEAAMEREYQEKLDNVEPYLVDKLTDIYDHIFAVDLSEYRNVIFHLISNTLHALENTDTYLIHVSEQDYQFVSMQKTQIAEDGGVKPSMLEFVEDRTLGKNECLIETPDGIYDCSLSVQLSELKRKLLLLSYSGAKEQ